MAKKKSLIEIYFEYQNFYEEKYGNNVIIAMEVGSFFEFYGVENDTETIGKVSEIAEILNIQTTRKNKAIKDNNVKNPMMAGVPTVSFKRYLDVLLKIKKYTIVLIEQITEPPNPKRAVTEILSPGTFFDISNKDANNLVSIFIEEENNNTYTIGCSSIDISTGKNLSYETYSSKNDNTLPFNEAERFINSNYPKEIIINSRNLSLTHSEIKNKLNINNIVSHIKDTYDNEIITLNYQQELLNSIFENNTMLNIVEYLNFEMKKTALNSYIFLLKFAYEHNPNILNKIEKPEIWEENKYLNLANNAIYQLNLINKDNIEGNSLFEILNHTSTAIGRRLLKFKLLNPIVNIKLLNNSYEEIEKMIPIYNKYEDFLKNIYDIERLYRKIILEKLQPSEFSLLANSFHKINNVYEISKEDFNKDNNILNIQLSEFIHDFENTFDINEMSSHNLNDINKNFFNNGYYKEIDTIEKNIYELQNILNFFIDSFNKKMTDFRGFKLERTDKEGYYIYITNNKFKEFKNLYINEEFFDFDLNLKNKIKYFNLKSELKYKYENLTIKNLTNNKKITFELLDEISNKLIVLHDKLFKIIKEKYLEKMKYYSEKYENLFLESAKFISNIDVLKSNAKNAVLYNYHKPQIIKKENSFIDAKNLRHPIVERIETNTEYIPNDINLGVDKDMNGMLLYGINASGKSVLMKSVGISIIMAQSGMFVPSNNFKYSPFNKLYTRILGEDNMLKGLSSFAVEMTELRNILRNADDKTLVLGDEISHGTETTSGLSIVASAIIELSQRNSKLIFATHLHELSNMEYINDLENIKHYHLKVVYEEKSHSLIYNRKLIEGSGDSIYGLEVARAMDLDKNFIERAYNIRNNIVHQNEIKHSDLILQNKNKKSKYNKEVLITKCIFCNSNAEHSHHILEQSEADEKKYIGDTKMNRKSNILPICSKHHQEIHKIFLKKKELSGEGGMKFITTSTGTKLWINPKLVELMNIDIAKKKNLISF